MNSYSQAKQDLFALKMTGYKKNGFYLEIGGSDPININNTYLMEKDFMWKGVSLEISENHARHYNSIRINKCLCQNALQADYKSILQSANAPSQIDYLSIDIEPAENTFKCFTLLPHDTYRFSVITFEHEYYQEGPAVRNASRSLMNNLGYQIVVEDVKNIGNAYEDWYVDPRVIDKKVWEQMRASNIEYSHLSL